MNRKLRQFIQIWVLLWIPLLNSEAFAPLNPRIIQQRYRPAALEIARYNPIAADRLRNIYLSSKVDLSRPSRLSKNLGKAFHQQLNERNIVVQADERGRLRLLTDQKESFFASSNQINELLGRKILSLIHLTETFKEMKIDFNERNAVRLEPRRDNDQKKSMLEAKLEEMGVHDYQRVAESFVEDHPAYYVPTTQATTLLRIFGGDSKPNGRFLFCCLEKMETAPTLIKWIHPSFENWVDARGLATPHGNLMQDLALVHIQPDTRVIIGTVADNFSDKSGRIKPGGNTQIVVVNNDFPYEHYRLAETSASVSDIIVFYDGNKIARYMRR